MLVSGNGGNVTTEESGGKLSTGELERIENDLAVLATAQYLPIDAIDRCLRRIDEAAPPLRVIVARAAGDESLSDGEARLLCRGLYILAGARDSKTCQPLLRLLRLPEAKLDDLLGDALAEGMTRIIASVFDGDADALFAFISDSLVVPLARSAALNAAIFLTWKGRIGRDRMKHFLERFYADVLTWDEDVWESWIIAVALLGLRELAPLVYRGFADGRISDWFMVRSEFDDLLIEAEQRPDDAARFVEHDIGCIEDAVEALAWSDGGDIDEDAFERRYLWAPPEPVRNPWRHVGRNDPCPCGSGLKFKKCCLAGM